MLVEIEDALEAAAQGRLEGKKGAGAKKTLEEIRKRLGTLIPAGRRMASSLCAAFFLSGLGRAALRVALVPRGGPGARQQHLASSVILAGFMGGLTLGNALGARRAGGSRTARLFAALEEGSGC